MPQLVRSHIDEKLCSEGETVSDALKSSSPSGSLTLLLFLLDRLCTSPFGLLNGFLSEDFALEAHREDGLFSFRLSRDTGEKFVNLYRVLRMENDARTR